MVQVNNTSGFPTSKADAAFQTDAQGRIVFYPWRGLAPGRVLPNEESRQKIHHFTDSYMHFAVIFPVVALSVGNSYALPGLFGATLAAMVLWYVVRIRKLTSGLIFSDRKYDIQEGFHKFLSYFTGNLSHTTLHLGLWTCVLMAGLPVYMGLIGKSINPKYIQNALWFMGIAAIQIYLLDFKVKNPKPEDGDASDSSIVDEKIRPPYLTYGLLAALVIVFMAELWLAFGSFTGQAPIPTRIFLALGGLQRNRVLVDGDWYRMLTSILLHLNSTHLLGNAIAFYFAGLALESLVGRAWFFTIFFLGGLGGSFLSLAFGPASQVSLGVSGALTALMAAAFMISLRLPLGAFRIMIQEQMLPVLVGCLVPQSFNYAAGHTNYNAHFGGALCGGLLGFFLFEEWRGFSLFPRFRGLAIFISAVGGLLYLAAGYVPAREYWGTRRLIEAGVPGDQVPASEKDFQSWTRIGWMYQMGKGVPRDYAESVKWYWKAAEQGDAAGQNNLGCMFQKGLGVTKDYAEAIAWFQKSAAQGNILAQKNLAIMKRARHTYSGSKRLE